MDELIITMSSEREKVEKTEKRRYWMSAAGAAGNILFVESISPDRD